MADDEITWTQQQKLNTLAAVEILKSYYKGDPPASTKATLRLIDELGVEAVLSGYNNVCALLTNQISILTKRDSLQIVYDVEETAKNVTIVG